MNEKQIYGGLYFVCPDGSIKTNNWKNTGKTAFLKPATDKKGYLRVGLMVSGKLITKKVHRLVAECFIPNSENKPQVNHINGIKSDNRIENLEWCTNRENTNHAIRHGLFSFQNSQRSMNRVIKRGELNGEHLLNENQVIEIRRKFIPRKYTRKMLAKEYGVTESCIKDVVIRKSWKHI